MANKATPATEEKALATIIPPGKLAVKEEAPDYLRKGNRGAEEVEQEDLILPRLSIAQALTPQRKKADPRFIPGLDEGHIFNTVTGEIYGTEIDVVPLFFFKQRMKFEDIEKGGGLLCISRNSKDGGQLHPQGCATCPHNSWVDGKPDCNLLDNFAVLLYPSAELGVISFKSTGITVAKQWNSMIRISNRDMFARIYTAKVVDQTKHNNTYGQYKLIPKKWVDQDFYLNAEQYFNDLRARGVRVDTAGMEGDDTEFTGGGENF